MRASNPILKILILGSLTLSAFVGDLHADSGQADMDTRLPGFSLIGVILMQGKSPSAAILKNSRTNEVIVVREGEDIQGFKLVRALANRIILQSRGGRFQMFLRGEELTRLEGKVQTSPQEDASIPEGKTALPATHPEVHTITYELVRNELERKAAEEWSLIMREAKILPFIKNGGVKGFRVAALPQTSFISTMGILAGDVIREVNGVVLNDMKTLFSLYERFREENRFEILLERDGKTMRLLYILR